MLDGSKIGGMFGHPYLPQKNEWKFQYPRLGRFNTLPSFKCLLMVLILNIYTNFDAV